MSTFITRLDGAGDGPRLAVKDLIDVAGVPTTAGSRAVAEVAAPAAADAPLLKGARDAGARIVGKANLHELAAGGTGINPWFGTPVNPLDEARIPGGSSSGSAVAVASGEADVAYGSDTAGSVRIPSACCGTVGLKTTFGRVPLEGVWPLCGSLDTVGPMAADVAGVVLGMQLLEPGFAPARSPASVVGRLRIEGTEPVVDAAVDRALATAELEVVEIDLPGWSAVREHVLTIFIREAYEANRHVLDRDPDGIGDVVRAMLQLGAALDEATVAAALAHQAPWRAQVDEALDRCQVLAMPTLPMLPPPLDQVDDEVRLALHTMPVNLSGHPAISLPVPSAGGFPASLQLVGRHDAEDLLCASAASLEQAVAAG